MKIAVSAKGGSLNAQMDERFGRCEYFVIVDSETNRFNAVFNPSFDASGGAGPSAAKKIAEHDAEVLITGSVGVNAQQALDAAGIKVVTGALGTVKDVEENYLKNK
ncbi:NifB/NifX family molybdenum-iron cluster-binding protein [candidate division KSB1 bacterium]|nr:NifB/NifX family molybdenum-iron cluster-binding protein [candidate division KSB1 bacterium]